MKSIMTRRQFCYMAVSGSAMRASAYPQSSAVSDDAHKLPAQDGLLLEQARKMARDEGLAVIEAGATIIDLSGKICGQLSLASGPADAQVSPDGNFAVWCPRPYAQPDPRLQEQVLWSDADNPIGALRVSGVATMAAIASGATKIAAVLATETDFRLVLIDVATGEETNLTPSFPKMELQRVQRMRLSNSADRLLLGWDYEFRVLDLALGKVMLEHKWRYASLSPEGDRIAFIQNEELYVRTLHDGSEKRTETDLHLASCGGWSPNGRFLICDGIRRNALEYRVVIVDDAQGSFAYINGFPEEVSPEKYWIRRAFCRGEASGDDGSQNFLNRRP